MIEYRKGDLMAVTALWEEILAQNSSANKKDPLFITIKVGTPR